jgi:hypothetical protein
LARSQIASYQRFISGTTSAVEPRCAPTPRQPEQRSHPPAHQPAPFPPSRSALTSDILNPDPRTLPHLPAEPLPEATGTEPLIGRDLKALHVTQANQTAFKPCLRNTKPTLKRILTPRPIKNPTRTAKPNQTPHTKNRLIERIGELKTDDQES